MYGQMGDASHGIITETRLRPRTAGDDVARPGLEARAQPRAGNATPQAGASSEPEPRAETAVAHLRGLFQRRKLIIAATFVAGMCACLALAALIPKSYSAKALLLIDPQPASTADPIAVREAQRADEANIETEMSTLLSRQHLRAVLDSLEETAPDQAEMLGRVGWIRSLGCRLTTAGSRLLRIGGLREPAAEAEEDETAHEPCDAYTDAIEARERKLDDLEHNTKVLQELRSRIVAVRFTAASPTAASTIANRIVEVYVDAQSGLRKDQLRRELDWADRVAGQAKTELDHANQEISAFIAGNIMPDDARTRAVEQQMFVLRNQLSVATADLTTAVQRVADLRLLRTRATDWDYLASRSEFPRVAHLAQTAKDLVQQRQEGGTIKRTELGASPAPSRLDQAEAEIVRVIDETEREQQFRVETATSRREAAQKALASVEAARSEATAVLTRLAEIKKKAAHAEAVFQSRTQTLMRFQERLSVFAPNLRMLSAATPPLRANTPPLPYFVPPAVIASLILGCLLALAVDLDDARVRSRTELETLLGAPCGTVPPSPAGRGWAGWIGRGAKRDAYGAAVGSLALACTRRRNVLRPLRTIAVVSASDREGRARLAAELAQAASALNRRTLLLRIEQSKGKVRQGERSVDPLTHILTGECDPRAAIQYAPDSGVDVLACGATDLDRLNLFADDRISGVLNKLAMSYDLIVMDVAPLRDALSSAWIAAEADMILFVARSGLSDGREIAERTAQVKTCAGYAWAPPEIMGVLTH